MSKAAFGKAEKLKRRTHINVLFAEGRSMVRGPVRLKYHFMPPVTGGGAVQAGVSASRKTFKRAVDRNRIKRLLREAYRLQKAELLQTCMEKNVQLHLFFIYTAKEIAPFATVHKAIHSCLHQLQQNVQTLHENTH